MTVSSIGVRIGDAFRRMGTSFVNYMKLLKEDYTNAVVDTAQAAWSHKLRTCVYTSIIVTGVQAVRTNPTFEDYVRDVLEQRHQLLMLGHGERNSAVSRRSVVFEIQSKHIEFLCFDAVAQHLGRLADVATRIDQERLSHLNLYLCSIIYKIDAGSRNCLYSEHCKPLRPKWRHYWRDYVWDVGAFGYWYHLQKNFSDFDISEDTLALPDRAD